MKSIKLGGLFLLPVTLSACNATYAPPVRSLHYGMPGRLSAGQGEVAVSGGIPGRGGAMVGLPIARGLTVEGNYDGSENFHMGSLGLRETLRLNPMWAIDFEGGGGLGVGGERCGNSSDTTTVCSAGTADGRSVFDRLAYGGYLGAGVGFQPWRVVGFFARIRGQLTGATNIPATGWVSAVGGVEFHGGPLRIYLAAGGFALFNNAYNDQNWLAELGLSVPFTLWR